jgi:hypothetical protein
MSIVLNGDSGITTPTYGGADTSEYLVPVTQFKNRIINGAMVIDQRNAGASISAADGSHVVDRWRMYLASGSGSKGNMQQNLGSVTPPTGFKNYIGFTTTSAYSVASGDAYAFQQRIEGFNIADLGWGTANASAVTLSFRVYSSLTGTFGGSLRNSDGTRSYPFSYTISSANTWTTISIAISGETTGTWVVNNGVGAYLSFGLGVGSTYSGTAGAWASASYWSATGATSVVGTNGATFYITGVQLEVGSTATSFDYRPYGTELALCQRYYYRIGPVASQDTFGTASADSATVGIVIGQFPVTMRTAPSALEQSGTATDYVVRTGGTSRNCSAVPTFDGGTSEHIWHIQTTVASGQTAGQAGLLRAGAVTTAYLGWSAEL